MFNIVYPHNTQEEKFSWTIVFIYSTHICTQCTHTLVWNFLMTKFFFESYKKVRFKNFVRFALIILNMFFFISNHFSRLVTFKIEFFFLFHTPRLEKKSKTAKDTFHPKSNSISGTLKTLTTLTTFIGLHAGNNQNSIWKPCCNFAFPEPYMRVHYLE